MKSLHCLHEDLKLNVLMHSSKPSLARLLLLFAHALGAANHADHYARYHPELAALINVHVLEQQRQLLPPGSPHAPEAVPDVFRWVHERFDGRSPPPPVSEFADPSLRLLPATRKMCSLISCLLGEPSGDSMGSFSGAGLERTASEFGQVCRRGRVSVRATCIDGGLPLRCRERPATS